MSKDKEELNENLLKNAINAAEATFQILPDECKLKLIHRIYPEWEGRAYTLDLVKAERERMKWSFETFIEANQFSSLLKCREEIEEIENDMRRNIRRPEEFADAIMCILDAAGRIGISSEEVITSYIKKVKIKIHREWKKNENNTYSHKKN